MFTPQTTETDAVTVAMPKPLHAELAAYADAHDADLSWALRRAARFMLDGEDEQAQRLAAPKPPRPKAPAKRRRRKATT